MSKRCTNKKLSEMLYAYELGLLGEKETEELEIHLLECEACFEKVCQFEAAADLLRSNAEIRHEILSHPSPNNKADKKKSVFATKVIPAVITIAAVIALLIINPWTINITTDEINAESNGVSVLNFENLDKNNNSKELGEIISNLLITNLSESQSLHVISYEHLNHIIEYLAIDPEKVDFKKISTRLEQITTSKYIITGDILQTQPNYIISSRIIELSSAKVIASQKIEGNDGEDIFSVVDKLTDKIRTDLLIPGKSDTQNARPLSQITTNSIEAYRYYLDGLKFKNMLYIDSAISNFEHAVALDSTFSTAYYQLVSIGQYQYIREAIKYISNCGAEYQALIKTEEAIMFGDSLYALSLLKEAHRKYPLSIELLYKLGRMYKNLGDLDNSILALNQLIKIDSLNKIAYNELAYTYYENGSFEKAIDLIDQYIKIAPNEPNPYDSKGHLYYLNNQPAQAIVFFKKALELKPDYKFSLEKITELYILDEKYDSAAIYITRLNAGSTAYKSAASNYMASMYLYQGKTEKSLEVLEAGIKDDEMSGNFINLLYKYRLRSKIYILLKKYKNAIDDLEAAHTLSLQIRPYNTLGYKHIIAALLAEQGDIEEANKRAESIQKLRFSDYMKIDYGRYGFNYIKGEIAYLSGDKQSARAYFSAIDSIASNYESRYLLGKVNDELNNYVEAITILESLLNQYSQPQLSWPIYRTKGFYYLGHAYEQKGDYPKAREYYEKIIRLQKDADFHFEEYYLAQKNLKNLGA